MRLEPMSIPSKVAWKLRPEREIRLESVKVTDGRYLSLARGGRRKMMALIRVGVAPEETDAKLDYSAALRSAIYHQRVTGLFEGLRRSGLPFIYAALMSESGDEADEARSLEFDLVVGTWVVGRTGDPEVEAALERNASVLAASVSVALPDAAVERLTNDSLHSFAVNLLLPKDGSLPQSGNAEVLGSLVSFEAISPAAMTVRPVPDFYVPSLAESGKDGLLLGTVRSSSGDFHDFRLRLEDLRQHLVILGMTGSGKSTTGATLVKQVAELGLPVLILDWHNEYRRVVEDLGGRVAAPGKDDFSVNPVESGFESEPAEHVAMVSDIFSDVYHFTHPQAYMFRNALQKRIGETSADEVPSLAGLVKTIEAYPLRSAYDNETKVALLRRLVPLTEGQAGRAMGGPGTVSIEQLLESVACIELGHLRDVQTRAVFADVILKMVYEQKVRDGGAGKHMTLVEEARNIAPARRPEDPPSVGERMISELRKFGESMAFIAQFPTQVASEVIKNSGTKVVHRVAWPEDMKVMGDSMTLSTSQREYLAKLRVGEAVVSVTRLPRPFLLQVKASVPPAEPGKDVGLGTEE